MAKGRNGQQQQVQKFPEVGTFKEVKALKKHYKGLTTAELDEWIALEGLTWNPCGDESINRMRRCMAILYKHFPQEAPKPKQKSKYADIPTETLIEMAAENNVPVEVCDDMKILRMRTIMSLRAHKLID